MSDRAKRRLHMLPRRDLLRGSLALFGVALVGCKKTPPAPPVCTDESGLSPDDKAARASLAYQDRGPDPTKNCDKCQQYVDPPAPGQCATCKVIKGPVSSAGTCKVFTARSA